MCELTDCPDELHLDARVLQSLAILWSNRYGALDRLAVHVQGDALAAALVELDIDSLAFIEVLEDDVDVDGGGEEEGSHRCVAARGCAESSSR